MANADFRFGLHFASLPKLGIRVVSFSGNAALNSLYSFEITALATTSGLNSAKRDDILSSPVTLTVSDASRHDKTRKGKPQAFDARWHGIVTGLKVGGQVGDATFLTIRMGPSLEALSGQVQNRIHLDSDTVAIVKDSLVFGGHPEEALSLRLDRGSYPKREFVFQREEDMLSFVFRQLEREGIALWHDQSGDQEELVLSDSMQSFQTLLLGDSGLKLAHAGVSGLSPTAGDPLLYGAGSESSVPPKSLRLRDYNWVNPYLPLDFLSKVAEHGRGELYLYGEGFDSESEGKRLASIIREGLLCHSELFRAHATIPGLMPGMLFSLTGRESEGFDGDFLVLSATYEGRAASVSGLGAEGKASGLSEDGAQGGAPGLTVALSYLRQETPYRPQRRVPKPSVTGVVTAWIDGSGGSGKPELDGFGRYKALLPLDASGRGSGKASCWLRQAQPSVGVGLGQSFPLTPGTEVLLSFVDGNPDRPLIQGAIPNGETGSMVNDQYASQAGIGTRGGSGLAFTESAQQQGLALGSGSGRGMVTLSSHSPTTAMVSSDTNVTLCTTESKLAGFTSGVITGMEHSICASADGIATVYALLSVIKDAAEQGSKLAETLEPVPGKGVSETTQKRSAGASTIAQRAFGLISQNIGGVYKIILDIMNFAKKADPSELRKHANQVTLSADDKGAKAIFRAKISPENKHIQTLSLISYLNNVLGMAGGIAKTVVNIQDAVDNKPTNENANAAKAISATTEAKTSIATVVSDFLKIIALHTKNETKGILVENKDSYLGIRAKTFACIGSKGPLAVESSACRVADLLNMEGYDNSIPAGLLKRETVQDPPESYLEGKGVLLRSGFIKAFAEEASLMASKAVLLKSQECLQFLVGQQETTVGQQETNASKAKPLSEVELEAQVRKMAVNGGSKVKIDPILNKMYYDIWEELLKIKPESFDKGALFLTNKGDGHIELATKDAGATISLTQSKDSPVSLTLQEKSVELKAADNFRFFLGIDPKKITRIENGNNSLEFADKKTTLKLDALGNPSIQFTDDAATFSHGTKIAFKGGQSVVEITSSDIRLSSKLFNLEGKTANIG
ncbi:MAG: type VI secretion system tip protein VgrG [Deltaproteobacteria bacterium]|jgi:type VI secretion system VgrG family protein|nr:type VI secretion system tip protein VgrG [Deltaproteobacteria bacterium]